MIDDQDMSKSCGWLGVQYRGCGCIGGVSIKDTKKGTTMYIQHIRTRLRLCLETRIKISKAHVRTNLKCRGSIKRVEISLCSCCGSRAAPFRIRQSPNTRSLAAVCGELEFDLLCASASVLASSNRTLTVKLTLPFHSFLLRGFTSCLPKSVLPGMPNLAILPSPGHSDQHLECHSRTTTPAQDLPLRKPVCLRWHHYSQQCSSPSTLLPHLNPCLHTAPSNSRPPA